MEGVGVWWGGRVGERGAEAIGGDEVLRFAKV